MSQEIVNNKIFMIFKPIFDHFLVEHISDFMDRVS